MTQKEYDSKIDYIRDQTHKHGQMSVLDQSSNGTSMCIRLNYLAMISTSNARYISSLIVTVIREHNNQTQERRLTLNNQLIVKSVHKADTEMIQNIYDSMKSKEIAKELFEF